MSTRTSNGLTTTDVRFRVRSGRIFAVSVETGRVISPSVRFTKLDSSSDPHPAGLPYRWGGQDYRNHYLSELDVWYLETLRVTRCSCIDQSFFGVVGFKLCA